MEITRLDYLNDVISFTHYSKVVNNICIVYHGTNTEDIINLSNLLPILREKHKEVSISLCIEDTLVHLANDAFPLSKLPERKTEFAYVKELYMDPCQSLCVVNLL